MELNVKEVRRLLDERGWSEYNFAKKLNLDYSYIYRLMRAKRGVGKKAIKQLIEFCENEGLEFRRFIILKKDKIDVSE